MKRLMLLLVPAALVAGEARWARLGDFEGNVEVQLTAASEWMPAERNLPLPESAWLRTGPASRVEIELDEGSTWRLGPNSQGEISDYIRLTTGQRVTLLALDRGLGYFTGEPEGRDALTLAVPGAQVIFTRGARVRLEVEETWSRISVLEGTVRFSSPAAEIDLRSGQNTRVEPANPARFFLNKETPPLESDRWSETRDHALANSTSAGHVIERYGLADLDAAGKWVQTEDLGAVWKPEVPAGWVPFRNGRWRWYDALGYTWVGGEPWGWLPYHYGRWQLRENLGWIWAPGAGARFKPGEVYWLRGAKFAGWGALAPGEAFVSGGDSPRQFLPANTTFAGFEPDAAVVDPAGFTGRPEKPQLVAAFVAALPSPAFPAARLDRVRPARSGARVAPVLPEAAFQTSSAEPQPTLIVTPPPPPPVVIVSEPPPDPAPVALPEPYPVAVYTGVVLPAARSAPVSKTVARAALAPTSAKADAPKGRRDEAGSSRPRPPVRERELRGGESEIVEEVARQINANNYQRALSALDRWTERYPRTDFADDRIYFYIVAHNGMKQPGKVVEAARAMSSGEVAFEDRRKQILALYLVSVNSGKLADATSAQRSTAIAAARSLLAMLPEYFTDDNRPPETSAEDWRKARADLEAAARSTLAMHRR